MKRLLLSLLCCSPLVFFPTASVSLDLTGPGDEQNFAYDQYGPVSPAETLWAISTKLRPDNSVSIQQTLVAIYKLNPYVFYEGNINKIIPQSVINIPPFQFVAQQTDKEAMALINKYSKNRKAQAAKTVKPDIKAKETMQEKPPVVKPEPPKEDVIVGEAEVIFDDAQAVKAAQVEFEKEKLAAAELELQKLQEELLLVNEQLLVTTEENQSLKMKLQPLEDTISELQIQMEDEALIQKKLQKIIDEYRAELDAVVEPPFSGEGMLNEILRAVTSSLLNLAIVILAPVLILLAVFLVVARLRSKRLLAEQEQEMAESTAILMEESGQFDVLLTDEFSEEAEPDLDFSKDEAVPVPEAPEQEQAELDDEIQEIDLSDASDDSFAVDLTSSDVVDLTAEDEVEASEDDPFGIGALSEEELISSVDLDEPEVEHSADDPFGIGALVEEEDLISGVDLVDTDSISPEEQADLDLAAQWESQLSEDSEESDVKLNDAAEQDESDVKLNDAAEQDESDFDLTAASTFDEQASDDSESPAENGLSAVNEEIAETAIQETETELSEDAAELDAAVLAELEETPTAELDLSEPPALEAAEPEEEAAELDEAVLAELEETQTAELDLSEPPALEAEPEEEVAELDAAVLAELEETQTAELDLSEPLTLETEPEEEAAELDAAALAELEETQTAELDLSEPLTLETEPEEDAVELDAAALAELEETQTAELDLSEPLTLETEAEEDAAELDAAALAELEETQTAELDLSEPLTLETEPEEDAAELDLAELSEDIAEFDLSALETPQADAPETDTEAELDLSTLEALDSNADLQEELAELDLSSLETIELEPEADDISDLSEQTAEFDLTSLDDLDTLEKESSLNEQQGADELTLDLDDDEFDLSALDGLAQESGFKPTPLAEFEAEQEALEQSEHDKLAKQLSDVAFKSDAPLPKIDAESSDFIDIETLLENSEGYSNDEPYAELELDLGLDEFPDVVNSGESVDIDDDENGIGAQLDLARAYLEIDDKEGAKEILLSVLEDSNGTQRKEIDKLLSRL